MKTTPKKAKPYGAKKFATVGEYHAAFPKKVQEILQLLRQTINKTAPNTTETISYNIPTFKQHKNLVHYAAYENHIGFYPTSSPIKAFKKELSKFKTSKGAIQFPIEKPLPIKLIKEIVRFRLAEDHKMFSASKDRPTQKTLQSRLEGHRIMDPNPQHQRLAKMTFASVFPLYVAKVEKKGRTQHELLQVITWLTGFDTKKLQVLIQNKVTFEDFFHLAKLNPNAHLITGVICGYRVEDIDDPLTKQVRYLDKLVDELAKGRKMEKILRGS